MTISLQMRKTCMILLLISRPATTCEETHRVQEYCSQLELSCEAMVMAISERSSLASRKTSSPRNVRGAREKLWGCSPAARRAGSG
eukprot:6174405-Pleurochrysis_carterae.AAC.1